MDVDHIFRVVYKRLLADFERSSSKTDPEEVKL